MIVHKTVNNHQSIYPDAERLELLVRLHKEVYGETVSANRAMLNAMELLISRLEAELAEDKYES